MRTYLAILPLVFREDVPQQSIKQKDSALYYNLQHNCDNKRSQQQSRVVGYFLDTFGSN